MDEQDLKSKGTAMDKSLEEITLLLLSLMAEQEETDNGMRLRAATSFSGDVLAALQAQSLIEIGGDGKVSFTQNGLNVAEELEERFLDAGARSDVVL
jgi:hypothetical protein